MSASSAPMTPAVPEASVRLHPELRRLFLEAEARHFNDEELQLFGREFPALEGEVRAAREIRERDVAIVNRVVKEVFAQYAYEQHHLLAAAKCPRDVRYVVIYAVHAMMAGDPQWFEDKLLIWLKTILQAFDFPDRKPAFSGGLLADPVLEQRLQELPKKSRSIFHTYYRLDQEFQSQLSPESYESFRKYIQLPIAVLTEEY